MAENHIRDYVSHLAVDKNVSASTQNVALAALLFLYRDVLKLDLKRIEEVERANEVSAILQNLTGVNYLAGALMYGSGLRLMECFRLSVKDLDFSYNQIIVRSGKGDKDRVTPMPAIIKEPVRR
jgi:site-specific recombinase XerD